ncbi:hypothetical protein B0H19DRAFT_1272300 [Mycena capillaripes]|nr:hypothetical protein B0H19DRAFT_1272300 [Mycena capillaripes]
MKFAQALISSLALATSVSAQGAVIQSGRNGTTDCTPVSSIFFASNGGQCYGHDGLTPLRVASEDCAGKHTTILTL